MIIKQDPITKLHCREDGAVLMPPSKGRFKAFRWTFGSNGSNGYKQIWFHGKGYLAHQIICRAFHGSAPIGKPEVDHINRTKDDNRPENLHWVSYKENNDNVDRVDQSVERYGARYCENKAAWSRAYRETHREQVKACSKAYYEAHREEYKVRSKAYRERRKENYATKPL